MTGSRFLFMPSQIKNIFLMFLGSIIVGAIILIIPTLNKTKEKMRVSEKLYFSMIGIGFIFLEFTLIQLFIKFFGVPLYSFSYIIFTLLIAMGLGSILSNRICLKTNKKAVYVFIFIIIYSLMILATHNYIFNEFMVYDKTIKFIITLFYILPIGIALGIPMPLGMKMINKKKISWAWALNGFFTVFGGFLAIISSLVWGFKISLLFALLAYLFALICFLFLKHKNLVSTDSIA